MSAEIHATEVRFDGVAISVIIYLQVLIMLALFGFMTK